MSEPAITNEKLDQCTRLAAIAAAKTIKQSQVVARQVNPNLTVPNVTLTGPGANGGSAAEALAANIGENIFNRCISGQAMSFRAGVGGR